MWRVVTSRSHYHISANSGKLSVCLNVYDMSINLCTCAHAYIYVSACVSCKKICQRSRLLMKHCCGPDPLALSKPSTVRCFTTPMHPSPINCLAERRPVRSRHCCEPRGRGWKWEREELLLTSTHLYHINLMCHKFKPPPDTLIIIQ